MAEKNVVDITIIGGGPVGMFSSFYAGLRGMSVKILESLPQLGGQLSALYPEKYIYDIAGFPKVRAQELVDNLQQQMNTFPVEVCLNESVLTIVKDEDAGHFIITTNAAVHYSKTILITAGNGAFNPRLMGVKGEEEFAGKNLHYFVNDLEKFRDRNVAVFGGGDSAVDWALMLEPVAAKVTLIHRRDKFRAHEHSVEQLKASTVDVLTPYRPKELVGEEMIKHVLLKHAKEDEHREHEVDDVIVNFGFISELGTINDWGLEIDKNSIVVDSRMQTNIEGIFAAGDICTYDGKVKLIVSGFGEAPVAISNAKVLIDPTSSVQPLHSTSIMEQ